MELKNFRYSRNGLEDDIGEEVVCLSFLRGMDKHKSWDVIARSRGGTEHGNRETGTNEPG